MHLTRGLKISYLTSWNIIAKGAHNLQKATYRVILLYKWHYDYRGFIVVIMNSYIVTVYPSSPREPICSTCRSFPFSPDSVRVDHLPLFLLLLFCYFMFFNVFSLSGLCLCCFDIRYILVVLIYCFVTYANRYYFNKILGISKTILQNSTRL